MQGTEKDLLIQDINLRKCIKPTADKTIPADARGKQGCWLKDKVGITRSTPTTAKAPTAPKSRAERP